MAAILIATTNSGKLREFRTLLAPIQVTSADALGLELEVEESGLTFRENAMLKARAFAAASGCVTLADDSGLEVHALDGGPGVSSARFGGPGLDDAGRCRLLLEELRDVDGRQRRGAQFRCCLVALAPDGRTCETEGICRGSIELEMRGTSGFGYDPVFYVPECHVTMAQLPTAAKNEISHRARAIATMRPRLFETFPELVLREPKLAGAEGSCLKHPPIHPLTHSPLPPPLRGES